MADQTTVTVTPDQAARMANELASMQSKLATLEAAKNRAELDARQNEARAMLQRGEHETVLRQHRAELAAVQEQSTRQAVKTELRMALANVPLSPVARNQVEALLETELTAAPQPDGSIRVTSHDFRDVNTFVQSRMESPEWQHFRADRQPSTPPPPATPPALVSALESPVNLGQAMLRASLEHRAAMQARLNPEGSQLDVSKPFGLKPRR